MIPIAAQVDTTAGRKMLASLSVSIDKYLIPALDRAAVEVAKAARYAASKMDSYGTNREAIKWEKTGEYSRAVFTGTKYAIYLEEGIKPNQPKMPDVSGLYTWVSKNLPGADFKQIDRMTYVIARSIQKKGIRAQPFMAPTAEKMADRVTELIQKAVFRAIDEIGAGSYV